MLVSKPRRAGAPFGSGVKRTFQETVQTDTVELERIEPGRNAFRFYRAAPWPDLFGGVVLMREWGRIGQAGQHRL